MGILINKTQEISENGVVHDVFKLLGAKIKIKSKTKTLEQQHFIKIQNMQEECNALLKKVQDDFETIIKHKDMVIGKNYFSQFGEDRILDLTLTILKNNNLISEITYLDIGGNRPCEISNTYHFYLQGYKGVVIEPNPRLYEAFKKVRPNDIVLNVGIHFNENETTLPFYMFNEEADGLSSFSKESAEEMLRDCTAAIKYDVINIPVRNINKIIEDNFTSSPVFISLDVEGIDFDILKSFNFDKYRPIFWIIETATYTSPTFLGEKTDIFNDFMSQKGYTILADTYVNTIFMDKEIFNKIKHNN